MPELHFPLAFALTPLLLLVTPTGAAGQWRLDASFGGVDHEAIVEDPSSSSLVLGLAHDGSQWLRLSGALPMDSAAIGWASAGAGGEIASRGAVDVGFAAAGEAWVYDAFADGLGHGVLAEVGPFARGRAGSLEVELRSGAVHYRSDSAAEAVDRTLYSGTLLATIGPGTDWSAGGEVRHLQGPDGGFTFVGATAAVERSFGGFWGRAGRWLAEVIPTPEWELGAYFNAADRVQLQASARQNTNDPIFWSRPRRSWTVGISYSFDRRPSDPVPLVPPIVDGRTVLHLPLTASRDAPSVAGDFSDWEPIRMTRTNEFWILELDLAPGVYRYSFRRADGEWFLPSAVTQRVDDGFGGENGVLLVQ